MIRRTLIVAGIAIALAAPAIAHGPAGSKPAGANGGDIVDVDGGHIELVIAANELVLYVTDLTDAPMATAGLAARVIIQDGTKQTAIALLPRQPNLLVAPLTAPLGSGSKIVVSTTLAKDGKPVQARFVSK
jgi:hypothetical protein